MKIACLLLAGNMMLAGLGCSHLADQNDQSQPSDGSMAMPINALPRTCQFLRDAGHYYLATVEGKQPRVRPFGTVHIFEGRLYIQTGRHKAVARQLLANGRVELCAMKNDEWIRVTGVLKEDPRREAKVEMLNAYPSLQKMYSPDDDKTMVLYFRPGTVTATISSFSHPPIVLRF